MAIVTNTNGLNFGGLATGINTDSLVAGLTKINQQRIDKLKSDQTDLATKQTAFVALQAKLFDLQSKTGALSRTVAGAFDTRKVTSSDATAVTAAAGSTAAAGTYTLTVGSLARSHQIASQGFADPNAQVKQGTLGIQLGTGTATSVTVDSRNNTLQGLADSINASGAGVRAVVVSDGSATPYRLMLSATKPGTANAITLTNGLTTGTGADINPATKTLQPAADAQVSLGSGAGAITVTSSSNQLNDLIPGVSVNLLKADPNTPLTLTVASDTAAAAEAVKDFVGSYNAVKEFVASQSSYDAKTKTAGVLLGSRDAAGLMNDLAAAVTATVPGLSGSANRLSSVGLSIDNGGKMVLDEVQLNQALSGATGATTDDLKKLFGLTGSSDNPGVSFRLGTTATKPTAGTPYKAEITAPATRAQVVAAGPPASSITISPPNNSLLLKLNGLTSGDIAIDPGTYTPDEIVSLLQRKINAAPALSGSSVNVGLDDNGRITIASQKYGSGSKVGFAGGTVLSALGFAGTEASTGTDVAGRFVVGGKTEAATGSGQVLTGSRGNANTDGLQVQSTLTAPGSANVTVSQGLASRLGQAINRYLDPTAGRLKAVTDRYQKSMDDIDKTITKQNAVLQEKKDKLVGEFAAMESAVSSLKGIQTQLSALSNTNSNSNS